MELGKDGDGKDEALETFKKLRYDVLLVGLRVITGTETASSRADLFLNVLRAHNLLETASRFPKGPHRQLKIKEALDAWNCFQNFLPKPDPYCPVRAVLVTQSTLPLTPTIAQP